MPPTRAEIAAGLGFSTPSSAEDHLQALAKKGVIELVPGASRGLRLKDIPGVPVQGTLPLIGHVAAGSPILAAEHVEAQFRVDEKVENLKTQRAVQPRLFVRVAKQHLGSVVKRPLQLDVSGVALQPAVECQDELGRGL